MTLSRIVSTDRRSSAQPVRWVPGEQHDPGAPLEEDSAETSLTPDFEHELARRVSEAAAGAERRMEQSWREGHEAGYEQARGEIEGAAAGKVSEAVDAMLRELSLSVEQMLAFRRRIREQLEQDMVRLSLAIARRVVFRELNVDPGVLLGVVKAAVARVETREIHRLRLSRADHAVLESRLAPLLPESVELTADSTLPRGSVVLDTARGELDASLDTQLAEIGNGLADLTGRGVG